MALFSSLFSGKSDSSTATASATDPVTVAQQDTSMPVAEPTAAAPITYPSQSTPIVTTQTEVTESPLESAAAVEEAESSTQSTPASVEEITPREISTSFSIETGARNAPSAEDAEPTPTVILPNPPSPEELGSQNTALENLLTSATAQLPVAAVAVQVVSPDSVPIESERAMPESAPTITPEQTVSEPIVQAPTLNDTGISSIAMPVAETSSEPFTVSDTVQAPSNPEPDLAAGSDSFPRSIVDRVEQILTEAVEEEARQLELMEQTIKNEHTALQVEIDQLRTSLETDEQKEKVLEERGQMLQSKRAELDARRARIGKATSELE